MNKSGVMILGPGWVAGEHIKGYQQSEYTEVRSIVGIDQTSKKKAEEYIAEYRLDATYSENYEQELARGDIDIVSICLINNLHYQATLQALQARKHVLIEKPLCLSLEELKRLREEVKAAGIMTMIGHVARWYPAMVNAHKLVDQNKLGHIFYGESDYWHEIAPGWKTKAETAGSSLLMGGCHSVDLLRWFMGMERRVREVYAYTTGPHRRKDFEYPPAISGILKFEDGAIGRIGCCLESTMPYVFHYQFTGTGGTVRNNRFYLNQWEGDKRKFKEIEGRTADDPDVTHHPFPQEIQYFIECIRQNTEPQLSILNSYHTYEIIFAMEESAKTEKPVSLPL
ncbi:hypothetical protein GF337_12450 [candidate division KSB1 bacterium]|nr:hypothetical protein [candidate division KSB1 bacterium]